MTTPNTQDDLSVTLGVEEEFFLVDPQTRDLLADPDPSIFVECALASKPHKMVREFMRAQIEANTKVCSSIAELRAALQQTRGIAIRAAKRHGAEVMAASTHPFASWEEQETTPHERYETFADRFQDIIRQLIVGGMHIHAGFGDEDSRMRVMTAMRRYLPLLHALSTSSPFHGRRQTGFKSWRLTIIGALPRSGLPRPFHSHAEYQSMVEGYQNMRFIRDGSELWWDIRPASAYPTIELRICDVCTRIEDAVSIAALYASLIRMLMRKDREGQLPPEPLTELIAENRWVAQRFGVFSFFGDAERENARLDIDDHVAELVEELAPDARALGCEAEIKHALEIVREGTGADRQLDLFRLCLLEGASEEEAFRKVVDQVIADTSEGVEGV